jgi:hypothetical protein
MGVSHATLSQWGASSTVLANAKVSNVLRFCSETGVSVQWLLTGDGPRHAEPQGKEAPLVEQARVIAEDSSPETAALAYQVLAALSSADKHKRP